MTPSFANRFGRRTRNRADEEASTWRCATKTIGKWRRPGFLLEPLGWVQDRLSQAIAVEPRLVELLFNLDHARMHLIALALAHMSGEVTPDLTLILLQGSKKTS